MPRSRENQVKLVCEVCGKEYSVSKSKAIKYKHHYCSQECYKKQRQELHTVLTTCDYCGKTIRIEKADFDRCKKNHFCNADCWKKFLNQNQYILYNDYAELIIQNKQIGEIRAKIDLEDVERCKKYTWNVWFDRKNSNKLYVVTVITIAPKKTKTIMLHRFVMNYDGENQIDHQSTDRLDNRKTNLKVVTSQENMENLPLSPHNKSGYRGVCYNKQTKKWQAYATKNNKKYHAGYFETVEQAKEAAVALRNKLYTNNVLDRQSQLDI